MVSSLTFGFLVVGFHSSPLMLFIFFSCIPWCRCVELVFWSFGFFYSKFFGSSLAWALCICLFSLRGASYLLADGCVSSALDIRPFVSLWLYFSEDYSFSDPFFWFFALVLDLRSFVLGIALSHILSFYLFLTSACSSQDKSMVRWDKLVFFVDIFSTSNLYWVSVTMIFYFFLSDCGSFMFRLCIAL